jgi:hypothetical protein
MDGLNTVALSRGRVIKMYGGTVDEDGAAVVVVYA